MNSPKRYCPRCHERIRHTARRCHICGKWTLLWWDYALLALVAILSLALLFKFYL